MKIFSITIVQNQIDIIEDVVRYHQPVFDCMYIWDIGSNDGTTEKITELASEYPNIRIKTEPALFSDDLRGIYFHEIKHQYTTSDWCYQLDSDEFLKSDIRKVIRRARFFGATFIRTFHFNFCYTRDDYRKLRHYRLNYSEVRVFRNRKNLVWPIGDRSVLPLGFIVPVNLGVPSFFFINVFHFPFRSKKQIEKRFNEKLNIVNNKAYQEVDGVGYQKYRITDIETILANASDCKVMNNTIQYNHLISPYFVEGTFFHIQKIPASALF